MGNDGKKDVNNGFTLLQASPLGLRGKQSVQTIFKLSEKAIDAVSIVVAHPGIKQK